MYPFLLCSLCFVVCCVIISLVRRANTEASRILFICTRMTLVIVEYLHEPMCYQLNHTALFQGIAKAPRTTLSSLYLDNNSKKERTGFYIGNVYGLMYVLIVLSRVIITSQAIRFMCYLCS